MGACASNCLNDEVTVAQVQAAKQKQQPRVQGVYTAEEVAQHSTAASAWVIYKGKVYDVTRFLKLHPGGQDSVLNLAGTDCTDAFDAIHPYNARKMEHMCIGVLGSGSGSAMTQSIASSSPGYDINARSETAVLTGPANKVELQVTQKTAVSHDTVLLRFDLPSPAHRLGLHVGGHVMVHAPGTDGRDVVRPYTPVTLDSDLGHMDLLIKIYRAGANPAFPQGGKMGAVIDSIRVGQSLRFSGPYGKFKYCGRGAYTLNNRPPADGAPAGMMSLIAAGSGITPVYQVIRAVLEDPHDPVLLSLVYANRTEGDILLRKEIDALAAAHPARIKVLYVLSKPPAKWSGESGHVSAELIADNCFLGGPGVLGLVCGPQGFVDGAVRPGLAALGYDDAHTVVF